MANPIFSDASAVKTHKLSGVFTTTIKTSIAYYSDGAVGDESSANVVRSHNGANKLYWMSGQFSSTVKSSISTLYKGDKPYGVGTRQDDDTLWVDGGVKKMWRLSGRITQTIRNSLSVSAIEPIIQNATWDGTDTPWCGESDKKLYKNSGDMTSTMKTSRSVALLISDNSNYIVSGSNHTLWTQYTSDKFYYESGQFSSTIRDSLSTSTISKTFPVSLSTDDLDDSEAPATSDFSHTASGGLTIGGSATVAFNATYTASGGLTIGGSFDVHDFFHQMSGGLTIGGSAVVASVTRTYVTTGGLTVGGSSTIVTIIVTVATDTLWCGASDKKLYLNVGNVTTALSTSLDVSSIDLSPSGISNDNQDAIWCGDSDQKLYKQSGIFTSTVKTSIAAVLDALQRVSDISIRTNDTLHTQRVTQGKLYLTSGRFTSTIKSVYATGDKETRGISYDAVNANSLWCGAFTGKLYLQSGVFDTTIKDSVNISTIDTSPSGISIDQDRNVPWSGSQANKLYKQSGLFTSTLKTSASVNSIDTNITGIENAFVGTSKYVFTPSGGLTLGDTAPVMVSYIYPPSGGLTIAGTVSVIATGWDYTASGGLLIAGDSAETFGLSFTASGGLTIGGDSVEWRSGFNASGGLTTGGTCDCVLDISDVASGGLTIGATGATVTVKYTFTASGGLTIGGAVSTAFAIGPYTTSGGLTIGGSSDATPAYTPGVSLGVYIDAEYFSPDIGTNTTVNDPADSTNRVLEVGAAKVFNFTSIGAGTKTFYFKIRWPTASIAGTGSLTLSDTLWGFNPVVPFAWDNYSFYVNQLPNDAVTVEANRWYNVWIVLDGTANTFDVWIKGGDLTGESAFSTDNTPDAGNIADIDGLWFFVGATSFYYADNFHIFSSESITIPGTPNVQPIKTSATAVVGYNYTPTGGLVIGGAFGSPDESAERVPTTSTFFMNEIRSRIIEYNLFTEDNTMLSVEAQTLEYPPSDIFCLIEPGMQIVSQPMVTGSGRNFYIIDMLVDIVVWVRLELDESHREFSWITDSSLGAINASYDVINALQLYDPTVNSFDTSGTTQLVGKILARPMRLVNMDSGTRDIPGWGRITMTWEISYIPSLTYKEDIIVPDLTSSATIGGAATTVQA